MVIARSHRHATREAPRGRHPCDGRAYSPSWHGSPRAIRGGVREAAFSVNMAKTDNPTSKVRRMVLLPPAVLAPRGARVVINGHGLAVKQAWPRRTKTSMLDIVPSTLYNLAAS